LKPLLFAHLAALDPDVTRGDVDVQALARRLDADRGTVQKQLARFLERFGRIGRIGDIG
jgi:predicted transcriptional regulator